MNLIAFYRKIFKSIDIMFFCNMSVNSRSCFCLFKYCLSIKKSKSTHRTTMLYSIRIMHFLSKKLETSTDSNHSRCSCRADDCSFQATFNKPFHITHRIFCARKKDQIWITKFLFIGNITKRYSIN